MKVHHINCTTMCPRGGRYLGGKGGWLAPAKMVCHCLLIETDGGLVLVDTGLGLEDIRHPRRRLGILFTQLVAGGSGALQEEEAAVNQVKALGFQPSDVRHIVLTHLDGDHAGGVPDFPDAKVHVYGREYRAMANPKRLIEVERYRQIKAVKDVHWATYTPCGEKWFGFECVRDLEGLPPEILIVPVVGHTRGHAAIAVKDGDRWLLHCGDAYFYYGEMNPERRCCPVGLELFQRIIQVQPRIRRANQERLRQLARKHSDEVEVFCAHSPQEFAQYA